MVAWADVSAEFVRDGSLRDIYVLNTTVSDWQLTCDVMRRSGFDLTFTKDNVTAVLPDNVAELFTGPRACIFLLSVRVGGVWLNCHFFDEFEIEFDLVPQEVTSQTQLDAVLSFMATLSAATGKVSILTPENCSDAPFLRVSPSAVAERVFQTT